MLQGQVGAVQYLNLITCHEYNLDIYNVQRY